MPTSGASRNYYLPGTLLSSAQMPPSPALQRASPHPPSSTSEDNKPPDPQKPFAVASPRTPEDPPKQSHPAFCPFCTERPQAGKGLVGHSFAGSLQLGRHINQAKDHCFPGTLLLLCHGDSCKQHPKGARRDGTVNCRTALGGADPPTAPQGHFLRIKIQLSILFAAT